jgi:DNA repair protein RadC
MRETVVGAGGDQPSSFYTRRERLRQCLIAAGAENLPDYELLEVMLFTSNPRADAKGLAQKLLERFGSLAEVLSADIEALAAVGLMKPGIAGVKFVREVALRFFRAELHERPVVASWDKLISYCNAQIAHINVEEFHVLFLDRKNALIKDERQQRGTVDHTPVYAREVVRRALDLGASALILVHNHPSGDPTPSGADIKTTRDIANAAAVFDIALHDHLIIGRGEYASFRDLGLILPKQNPHRRGMREPEIPGGEHYREMAGKIREVARQCRFAGARRELLRLAKNYHQRADHFDNSPGG